MQVVSNKWLLLLHFYYIRNMAICRKMPFKCYKLVNNVTLPHLQIRCSLLNRRSWDNLLALLNYNRASCNVIIMYNNNNNNASDMIFLTVWKCALGTRPSPPLTTFSCSSSVFRSLALPLALEIRRFLPFERRGLGLRYCKLFV